MKSHSLILPKALAITGLCLLPGCDQWHLSINSDGLIFISVAGDGIDTGDRFRVRVRNDDGGVRTLELPASRQLTVAAEPDRTVQLTLLVPEGCRIDGINPQTVTATAARSNRVDFAVHCG